jgi:hypothetical protein
MNRKAHIEQVCSYILDQDHEYDNVVDDLEFEIRRDKTIKSNDLRDHARCRTWYSALLLAYGKREAEKKVTEAIKEAKAALKRSLKNET